MLLTYQEETMQPLCPITGLPSLWVISWSDIYMGPTSCLIVAPYLCSIFTLVVDLFNKDDAEDGGLSFFYSTETQSKN